VPRVKIFAGKAASSYATAKTIINLINDVANVINNDLATRNVLKVVFLPNYNVSLAEVIVPAADLSEQISTAGMEASGTGNMKFALNGALTIGTLDGANVEIRDNVGEDNIFIFGMSAGQVVEARQNAQDTQTVIDASQDLGDVLAAVAGGAFSPGDRHRYADLIGALRSNDWFMTLHDFADYAATQRRVDELWQSPEAWWRMSVTNTAGSGWLSADRAIRQYAETIWDVPVPNRLA
jgi:starch phosphorylase